MSTESLGLKYYTVGQPVTLEGKTLMYCNGIENTLDDATGSASLISRAFGNKQVILCHNPTTIQEFGDVKWEQERHELKLAASLQEKLSHYALISSSAVSVILFVHSHGAFLATCALKKLDQEVRNKIRIYSFGGVTMIPKCLGNLVRNCVINEDFFSRIGNIFRGNTPQILSDVKLINKKMKNENLTQEKAIVFQAYDDLWRHLNPSNLNGDRRARDDRAGRFEKIFINKHIDDLTNDPDFIRLIGTYRKIFNDYEIVLLGGQELQSPEYAAFETHSNIKEFAGNLPGNFMSILGNIFKGIEAVATHGFENHKLESYSDAIQEIATYELLN